MSKYILCVLAVALVVVGLGVSARAELITPVAADDSGHLTADYTASGKLITNWWANVSRNPWTGSTTDHNAPTTPVTSWVIPDLYAMGWLDNGGAVSAQWLWFDLGAPTTLSKIYVWNFYQDANENTKKRSVKDVVLYASDASEGTGAQIAALTFAQGVPVPIPCQQFDITATTQYVKMQILTNYGDTYVGLGEVRFESNIPEPGTLALLACGLAGLLAYAWRKRK